MSVIYFNIVDNLTINGSSCSPRANARYLWKRIPSTVKTGNVELDKLWTVYVSLWQNDLTAFFKAITFTWTSSVADLMGELRAKIYQETIALIGLAYSSIFEDRLGDMIAQTPEAVGETCQALGWTIEDGPYPRLVIPKRAPDSEGETAGAEEQLAKLTDFVSFLEN